METRDLTSGLFRGNNGILQPQDATHWLAAIVSSSTDAIVGKTCDGVVTSFNPAAESLFGYRAEEIIGRPVRILIPADRQDEEDRILSRIAAGERVEPYETIRLHKNGSFIDVSVSVSPVRDEGGRIVGAAKIAHDISGSKHAEAAQRESAATLLYAQRCANAGIWDVDLVNNHVTWSEPYYELFGLPKSIEPSYENWIASIHPDDQQRVHDVITQAIAGRVAPRVEFRILRDGEVRWLHSEGRMASDSADRPVRVTGLTWDITERKEAEAALRASEERHRTLVKATGAVTWCSAPSGLQLTPEPAWTAFTGQTAEEMFGDGWSKVLHPDDVASVMRRWFAAIAQGEPFASEHRLRRHDGAWRWVSVHAAPIRDAEGRIVEWFGMSIDITERKELEAVLRESEHKFKTLIENSPDIVSRFDREHRHIYTSPAGERIAGVPASGIVGKTHRELGLPPAICDQVEGELNRAFAGEALRSRFEFVDAEGSKRHFYTLLSPEFAADGSVQTVLTISRDVTEIVETQQALRESEARLQAVLNESLDPIFMKDREGGMVLANPATCAAVGKPAEAILGKTDEQFLDNPADARAIMANDRRIMLSGEPETVEEAVSTPSGTRYYVNKKVPRRDAAGNVIGLIGTARDVTERKRAEQALRESEERYRSLFEHMLDGFAYCQMLFDEHGRADDFVYLAVNHAFGRLTGLTDVIGKRVTEVIPQIKELTPELFAIYGRVASTGRPERFEIDFKPLGIYLSVSVYSPANGFFVAVFDNISERKRAEAALRESEDRERQRRQELETTLAAIPAAVLIADDKACTRITANRAGYELMQVPEGGNISKSAPEEERPRHFEIYSATGEALATDQLPMQQAAATGTSVEDFEYELRFADGRHRHHLGNALPLVDTAGDVRGAVGVFVDITERKHQEERIKLLLREVNHRAKNMLSVVQAVARQTVAASPDDFLERFSERVQAIATSQDLLVKADWKGVELATLVRKQLAHFQDLIGSRIELRGSSLLVSPSAAQTLGMAIHELATNAGKYGALSVAEGRVAIDWGLERNGASGETFEISWREHGGPPVVPPVRKGFGSTVIGPLVESSLDAKVALDLLKTGLSWRLRCPAGGVAEGFGPPPAAKMKSERDACSSSRPKVLVVEDEALVAMEIAHVLRSAGFEVVGPAQAVAPALSLIEEVGCDAAVLDINLRGETSELVAHKLLANGTKFVTLSGYLQAQHPPIFNGVPAIAKPLRPALLVAGIKRCLASKEDLQGQTSS